MSVDTRLFLCFGALCIVSGCVAPASPPKSSSVAPLPVQLAPWQGALTANEWRAALDGRFAPNGAAKNYVEFTPDAVKVQVIENGADEYFAIHTRAPNAPQPAPPPGARYWRTRAELGPAPANEPLAGVRIALDPGHLGGAWGPMEARSFTMDDQPPVQEGDLTLRVAQLLTPKLEALGAQVAFVRDKAGPLTG
mgnify:CR=1 FL=1